MKTRLFFAWTILVLFITGCSTMENLLVYGQLPSGNSEPLPEIYTNNFDKTVDLSTQALVHFQTGLNVVEYDNQSTVDGAGKVWGEKNNIQFVAVLPPGYHYFKIDFEITIYSGGKNYSYSGHDILFSHEFLAGHLYDVQWDIVDINMPDNRGLNLRVIDQTDNTDHPQWKWHIERLKRIQAQE